MDDCCFTKDGNRFRYRAVAIIVENDCILFAKTERDTYYYTVGGGVHVGETAEEAVVREVFEETGIHYEVDHLAIILENFFSPTSGLLKGLNCHELSFYFMMKPKGSQQLNSNSYEYGCKEEMYWLPIKDLDKYPTHPTFLKEYLSTPHNQIVHIVTDERKQ